MQLFDSCKTISIYDLMKTGCLIPDTEADITLSLEPCDEQPGAVSLHVNTNQDQPYINLRYTYGELNKNYNINLVSEPFRLNNSLLWYFVCPITGMRCRKLYFSDGYFQHRKAIKGVYHKQTIGPHSRKYITHAGNIQKLGEMLDKVTAHWFRKTYAGKPTSAYSRIIREIQSH